MTGRTTLQGRQAESEKAEAAKPDAEIAAGVTTKLWELEDLVKVLEEWEAAAKA